MNLKLSNILITNGINGRFVKLGNFGLSQNHEFISGEYDIKSDIYSLGVIIKELFFLKSNS
jgi:serine/threonine protein kinase